MIRVSTDITGNMVSLERASSPLEGFLRILVLRWEIEEGARRMERRPVGCAGACFPWLQQHWEYLIVKREMAVGYRTGMFCMTND